MALTTAHGYPQPKADLKAFALDEVVGSGKFSTIGVNATWISDTEFLYTDYNYDLILWDLVIDDWERILVAKDYVSYILGFIAKISSKLLPHT